MNALRCPQCEAPYTAGASSCDQCGFPLPQAPEPKIQEAPAPVPPTIKQPEPAPPSMPFQTEQRELAPPTLPPAPEIPLPLERDVAAAPFPEQPLEASPPKELNPARAQVPLPDNTWRELPVRQPVAAPGLPESLPPAPRSEIPLPKPRPVANQESAPQYQAPTAPIRPQPAQGPRRWKLVVVEGFSVEKEYLIYKDTMVLGRRDEEQGVFPDIDLEDQDDGFISRKHAVVRLREGGLVIEDLGGENGTLLDGEQLQPHALVSLAEGQVLRLGRVGLLVTRCPQRDTDGLP